MKVRMPKSYLQLPEHEKEIIKRVTAKEVSDQLIEAEAELQKIWLQYACVLLNKYFKFGKERCLLFLANWRAIYRQNSEFNGAEQTAYLTAEMDRIFGKNGYPSAFIDKLGQV